ncbi:hypothetical protein I5Q34_25800 [Streptomyces sp. AV19]|uniref:glycerophosphodiester phosphodiesterase family protein n=1 Tax=Streptomyces sp. AV19 TaxID=2793068 RepID=UPI0018FE42C5|nr:glycerophosphodiester phosphodiesterase family protein [Streptomyces sp. AV19]MBH1937643.1 hypothetical protein [Streptomyces sp. AV19]MDG4536312.1 glycerophosphodiester phosphodiesterase family protein [Streptomyces sp. AV19]
MHHDIADRAVAAIGRPSYPAPAVIAHRAGGYDMPENTLAAIDAALARHVDMVWLSVQVTRDGVPVLYRPADLRALTDGSGRVAEHTAADVTRLNAGHAFRDGRGNRPYRSSSDARLRLPRLDAALRSLPAGVPVVLDLKSPRPRQPAAAVARAMDRLEASGTPAWERTLFYSTRADVLAAAGRHPRARAFESRERTRRRLLTCRLTGCCADPPRPGTWVGFELRRDLRVIEHLTLGAESCAVPDAALWDRDAILCFRRRGAVRVVLFGVNTRADHRAAAVLGADAVLTDSPRALGR